MSNPALKKRKGEKKKRKKNPVHALGDIIVCNLDDQTDEQLILTAPMSVHLTRHLMGTFLNAHYTQDF